MPRGRLRIRKGSESKQSVQFPGNKFRRLEPGTDGAGARWAGVPANQAEELGDWPPDTLRPSQEVSERAS